MGRHTKRGCYGGGGAPMSFDEHGWWVGRLEALRPGECFSLLAPEPSAQIDEQRWAHQAGTFFKADLGLVQKKVYPAGTTPIADAVEVEIAAAAGTAASLATPPKTETGTAELQGPTRVLVVTVPLDRAPEIRAAAAAGVAAIGGAGFDALLRRARRVWQVRASLVAGSDGRAPLAVAAVLAAVLLAPVVPPAETTIFGVKGARERLAALGWRT